MPHNTWKRRLLRHTPILSGVAQALDRLEIQNQELLDRLKSQNQELLDRLESQNQELREHLAHPHELALSGNEPPMFIEKIPDLQELFFHIQNVWEKLGETEPYWSVLSAEQFKSSGIKDARSEFYNSGQSDVMKFFKTLERNSIDHSSLKMCLEYGCGLGRVTSWLSKRFESVIGYDISKPHLQLAQEYLDEMNIRNVSLHHISKPHSIGDFPKVDVVYSVIVLQHNPPPIIRVIIRELIKALNSSGVAFFQVPTYRLGYRFSLREYMIRLATRDHIEMHVLPQNEIFDIVNQERGRLIEVLEDGCAGPRYGDRSNTFVIQKE